MSQVSDILSEHYIPTRPYATNSFATGLYRKDRVEALEDLYIENTPKNYRNIVSFDLDDDNAERIVKSLVYDTEVIPEPNFLTINQVTRHAHFSYILDSPVGTPRGIDYLNDIRRRITLLSGSDLGYTGRIIRNPLQHPTEVLTDRLYSLKDLDRPLPEALALKALASIKTSTERAAQGRHQFLFEAARTFAYRLYNSLPNLTPEAFTRELSDFIGLQNQNFTNPLPLSELRTLERSITTWVLKNFNTETFSNIQRARVTKRWGYKQEDRNRAILAIYYSPEYTPQLLAEFLNLSPSSTRSALSRAKKWEKEQGI